MPTPALLVSLALLQPATAPAATQPTAPATQPAEAVLEAARREQRELHARSDAKAEWLRGEPIVLSEAFGATVQDGFLVIGTRLEADGQTVVRPLAGDDSGATVLIRVGNVRDAAEPAADPLPDDATLTTPLLTVQIRRYGTADDGDVIVLTEYGANSGPGQLNFARTRAGVGERMMESTQLIQFPPPYNDQGPFLRLYVNRHDAADPDNDVNLKIEAASFEALRRREPEVFDRYVRPMLADAGLTDALDGPTRDEATQAFLGELSVDEATRRRVQELVKQLDASEYAQRAEAQAALESLGRPGATALAELAATAELSPEQTSRVASVLSPYRPLSGDEVAARLADAEFLRGVARLQGGPDDAALRDLAKRRLDELGASPE